MANEKRLIDANALLELVQYRLPIDNHTGEVIAGCVNITRRIIENAPTVDAVVLPCKIGDSLWCVYSPPRPANPADKGKWYMGEYEVARFHYGVKGLSIEMYCFGTVSVKEIGKTVFLSREEAESALAKMDGDGNG